MTPDEIYAESYRIIEAEVGPHSYSAEEWPIVRRMIHASGDLELARLVEFRHDAVHEGLRALKEGLPIVTDVRMVAAGLNKRHLRKLGIRVHCFIDQPWVADAAREAAVTRSGLGMLSAAVNVREALFVIGNAPTALYALIKAVQHNATLARLVVAMPVGFVNVVESKKEVLSLEAPIILVKGRRGGSGMAAAAVNALLEMALEGSEP
jgi:precorrin-8X/cobalt-precorrin-8 methylmutase